MTHGFRVVSNAVLLGVFVWLLVLVPTTVATRNAGASVTGTTVDASLSALVGAVVTLEQAGRVTLRTMSGAAGRYTFDDVAPGDYRVRATHPSAPTVERSLRVRPGVVVLQLPLVLAPEVGVEREASEVTAAMPAPAPPPPPIGGVGLESRGSSQVTVTAAAPVVDSKRTSVGQAVARSPWQVVPPQRELEPRDRYSAVDHGRFEYTRQQPRSTFGADVDTASYVNVRRFLSEGRLPPVDAVRVEEMLNYFHPDYATPQGDRPVALTTEVGPCPWAPEHRLVLVGARARAANVSLSEGRSLVLLIDVSGSMASPDRLPLIKTSLRMFVDHLNPDDQLAIVTYAGSSGVALWPTPVRERNRIHAAIDRLGAGGSTNGAQGIVTAYRMARQVYIPGGTNRVMLATDGDFNVGVVGESDLVSLIERERESGVFLSIFGVGRGNLNDSALEQMANKGNGHYVYLDSLQEARRVLLEETDATLETVAKDVKFQVEFNPATVQAWKLIGYENRVMGDRDFNNDRKDGGEMGAGHTVTVLYEVVPAGIDFPGQNGERPSVDPLKYQAGVPSDVQPAPVDVADELMTVKVRYKLPDADVSALIEQSVRAEGRSVHLPFASAVAEAGLLLRQKAPAQERWDRLLQRVRDLTVTDALVADKNGFEELVAIARDLVRLQVRR